jgi:DNA-binding FadR family transcriptional regulator
MFQDTSLPPILRYIVDRELKSEGEGGPSKLPPMDELCSQLGMSRGKLREQLIAAEAWGVVEMRPGDGTYVQCLDLYPSIRSLLLYGTMLDRKNFGRYYDLRIKLEAAFWDDATRNLTSEDKKELTEVVETAERRLGGYPVEIPHREHRRLHLLTFGRLDNDFVLGLLKAYWDAYEAVGLHLYFEYRYYADMWASHRAMVEAIIDGRYDEGKSILIQHFSLLRERLRGAHGEEE